MLRISKSVVNAFILLCTIIGLAGAAHATPVTLNFEDLTDTYLFLGGGQNIGTFYVGLTFGPDVTGLSSSRFGYNDLGYPSNSPDTVIFSANSDTIEVNFDVPVSYVGFWYTTFDPLIGSFFDSGNAQLGSVTGSPNTDGSFGVSEFLDFTSSGPNIARATFVSTPAFFVLDDLSYETQGATPVPEPGTLLLVAGGITAMLLRKFVQ